MSEIAGFSAASLKTMRRYIGEEGAALAASLVQKHPALFELSLFHQTAPANIPAIQAAGTIYSHEQLALQKIAHEGGMTYTEKTLCEIFNTVSHEADAYTDFVYMRPHFGPGAMMPKSSGFYLSGQDLAPEMWMSFRDPNQTTSGDNYAIQMGISVVLGFTQGDAFIAADIPEALAIKTLSLMASVDYIAAFKQMVYEAEAAAHAAEPHRYVKPKEKDNMTLEQAFKFYLDDLGSVELMETGAFDNFNAKKYNDVWMQLIEEKNMLLPYTGAQLSPRLLNDPAFEQYFLRTFDVLALDMAEKGQIAVPQQFDVTRATALVHGVPQVPPASAVTAPKLKA